MHHGKHQCGIGTGERLNKPIGFIGSNGANGVDHNYFRTLAARLFNERPQVPVSESRIGSPQNDVLRINNVHGVGAASRTSGYHKSVLCDASA